MRLVQFSMEDCRTPESLELILRQFESAFNANLATRKPPSLSELVNQLAPLVRQELQAPGRAPLNLQSLITS